MTNYNKNVNNDDINEPIHPYAVTPDLFLFGRLFSIYPRYLILLMKSTYAYIVVHKKVR